MAKTKRCKQCKTKHYEKFEIIDDEEFSMGFGMYSPPNKFSFFCDFDCAADFIRDNPVKLKQLYKLGVKRELKQFKDNDKSVITPKAQTAFNAYIRKRDEKEPCISCGRHHTGQYHAGHYKTVGARKDIRFDEDNCHKQCSVCNNHLSGNLAEYTPRLIEKIGQERFDKLQKVEIRSYTVNELHQIIKHYKDKLKQLINGVTE